MSVAIRRDRTIQLKNQFFSFASHELRTPLGAIRGNSQLLMDHYLTHRQPEARAVAADIHDASVRLIRMVTNYLDAARLDQGKLSLVIQPVSVHAVAERVVHEVTALASEKSIAVRQNVAPELPNVAADEGRLGEILYNLVGNALKFTDTGSVTIEAAVEGGSVVVKVVDTGRAMSAADQQSLFKRFSQVRPQDASAGSGLGLYIAKLLAEKMGGRIWVAESVPGRGTTIAFSLPLASSHRDT